MESKFGTKNFNTLIEFIHALTEENNSVLIERDCEGVYMVDYISPYDTSTFERQDEE